MKLKTLKDTRKEFKENYGVEIPDQAEIYPKLKQEAIKDIKILSKDYRELDDKFFANFQSRETIAYIKWIS